MGHVQVAPVMARNKIVRNMNGDIVDWIDDTKGGWIVRKGQVVNQEFWQEHLKRENDKRVAAKAQAEQVAAPASIVNERVGIAVAPNKVDSLEKRVEGMEGKLDAILKALNK